MITNCRSCGSATLTEVLNLGDQYLSDFRDDQVKPPAFPLVLLLCQECTLVQLSETVPRELMYHDRYGFRSGVNEAIRDDLRRIVDYAIGQRGQSRTWLDIASNDGTLLSYVPTFFHRVGVDPVAAFAPEARRHADRIIPDYFDPSFFEPASFDVVTSSSMFYDLDDPGAFVAGVAKVLAHDGIWVIQQNYLLAMLQATSFDNVCHEHITYFSLRSLQHLLARYGLDVVDVHTSPVNGGVLRTLVTHAGTRAAQPSVAALEQAEADARLSDLGTWRLFAQRVERVLAYLRTIVAGIRGDGGRVYIYGASTRGATIWQAAGFTSADITAAVERQPGKVGRIYSAVGCPIVSEEQARADQPDAMLVGPWWFRDAFLERERDYLAAGGKLIIPLPELEVITA
jgi:NDP-4-keto-2,6-dideoxyhexose 3-C-methyltransferase